MEKYQLMLGVVFFFVWLGGFGSWWYGVYEVFQSRRLKERQFRKGRILIATALEGSKEDWERRVSINADMKFGVGVNGDILILQKFSFGRLRNPWFYKGRIYEIDGKPFFEARGLRGPIFFIYCWLIGWASGAMMMAFSAVNLQSIVMGGAGLSFGAMFLFIWRTIETNQAKGFLRDIQKG